MADDMEIERYRHETVELTVGQLRDALNELADETPVRIDVPISPRCEELPDSVDLNSVDSGPHHFVLCGVVLHDADYLMRNELVLQADFASDWYVRAAAREC
ncbi:DUF6225 family protein [Nonomuraea sp. NPDC048901]|uniref:DUF6225 family protein n=1 Tax=Nonomuraea sp. NPDC048901 TaxID=3155627 RepID=UPI003405B2ED